MVKIKPMMTIGRPRAKHSSPAKNQTEETLIEDETMTSRLTFIRWLFVR
jgi:hypothetical protein